MIDPNPVPTARDARPGWIMGESANSPVTRELVLYLAGLLEGEGSFQSSDRLLRIALHMTDRDIVERASALLGRSGKITKRDRHHQARYQKSLRIAAVE